MSWRGEESGRRWVSRHWRLFSWGQSHLSFSTFILGIKDCAEMVIVTVVLIIHHSSCIMHHASCIISHLPRARANRKVNPTLDQCNMLSFAEWT